MLRYAVDVAAVTAVSAAASDDLGDAHDSVTRSVTALDAVVAALGSLSGVQAAFTSATAGRRQSGPGLVRFGRSVLAAGQRGVMEFVRADEGMESDTNADEASCADGPPLPGHGVWGGCS